MEQNEHLACSMQDFFSHQYRMFDGTQRPMVVEAQITDLQELLEAIGCTDNQKVNYAELKLSGEATRWWQSRKQLLLLDLGYEAVFTWELLTEEYKK